jgi:hypothetical protein
MSFFPAMLCVLESTWPAACFFASPGFANDGHPAGDGILLEVEGFIVSMQTEPGYEKTAFRPPEGMGVFHPLGEQADASIDNLLQRSRVFLLILMRNQGNPNIACFTLPVGV